MVTQKGFTEWQLHKNAINKDATYARAQYAYMARAGHLVPGTYMDTLHEIKCEGV